MSAVVAANDCESGKLRLLGSWLSSFLLWLPGILAYNSLATTVSTLDQRWLQPVEWDEQRS